MMHKIRNHKWTILALFALTVLYFGVRLPNLTLQPIFADEAIYLRWAQVMRSEPTLRFLPLSDGKTPLYMWIVIPFFKLFSDPLYAGRFLSILSGYATLLGVFVIGWRFFRLKVAMWGVFLVAITPFMIFFDRMALVDSMLAAFTVWSVCLALLTAKYLRLDLAMFLGYAMGFSMLTKPPGFFNVLAIPLTLISVDWFSRDRQKNILRLFGLWLVTIIIAMGMYNILRLGPGFTNLSGRNEDYLHSPLEVLQHPLDPFRPHLLDVADWFPKLLTWPVLIFIIIGIGVVISRRNRDGIIILLWALLPLLSQMFLLQTFTARYLLISIPLLLILGAIGIEWMIEKVRVKRQIIIAGLSFVTIFFSALFIFPLLTNPDKAPLPQEERRGYLEDWTAGYGFMQISQFITEKSKLGKVVVGTEGSFGTLPDGLWIYLDKNPNVVVVGGSATISAQLRQAALDHPTYFVTNYSRFSMIPADATLIATYPKSVSSDGTQDKILLYQVFPGLSAHAEKK